MQIGWRKLMGDIHKEKAAEMFGIPESEVTDEQRQVSMAATFKQLYGGNVKPSFKSRIPGAKKPTGVKASFKQQTTDTGDSRGETY